MSLLEKIDKAKKIIGKGIKETRGDLVMACSLGKDSLVALDIAHEIIPEIKAFAMMTPFKFKETRKYIRKVTKYGKIKIIKREFNGNIYENDLEKCCEYYKVEPFNDEIMNYNGWISGLRNDERKKKIPGIIKYVLRRKQIIKINPIVDFTELDIWKYFAWKKLPVHPLYLEGYRSLGCKPCTKKIKDNEHERKGRWKGTCKQGGECGIHKT